MMNHALIDVLLLLLVLLIAKRTISIITTNVRAWIHWMH
jgi:hypothetical protein